jgi:hypothetical protein
VGDLVSLVVLGRHLDYVPLTIFSCCPQASLDTKKKRFLMEHAKGKCKNFVVKISLDSMWSKLIMNVKHTKIYAHY